MERAYSPLPHLAVQAENRATGCCPSLASGTRFLPGVQVLCITKVSQEVKLNEVLTVTVDMATRQNLIGVVRSFIMIRELLRFPIKDQEIQPEIPTMTPPSLTLQVILGNASAPQLANPVRL